MSKASRLPGIWTGGGGGLYRFYPKHHFFIHTVEDQVCVSGNPRESWCYMDEACAGSKPSQTFSDLHWMYCTPCTAGADGAECEAPEVPTGIFTSEMSYCECEFDGCENGGSTVAEGGTECDCPDGFTGPTCSDCDLQEQCQNGGVVIIRNK